VRTFVDGKLKPDTFSEKRILGFPPGVSALLITFNRFHNYVVSNLSDINQGGRFSGVNRDNDLFQTGRLCVNLIVPRCCCVLKTTANLVLPAASMSTLS
jgi:hypothetical protein